MPLPPDDRASRLESLRHASVSSILLLLLCSQEDAAAAKRDLEALAGDISSAYRSSQHSSSGNSRNSSSSSSSSGSSSIGSIGSTGSSDSTQERQSSRPFVPGLLVLSSRGEVVEIIHPKLSAGLASLGAPYGPDVLYLMRTSGSASGRNRLRMPLRSMHGAVDTKKRGSVSRC